MALPDRARAETAWAALFEAAESAETLFEFARSLKAWRWTGTPEAEGIATYIEDTYERYCRVTGENMQDVWEILDLGDSGDPRGEFVSCWQRVRVPAGQSIWQVVVESAERFPFVPVFCPSQKYQTFVSLAGHLQRVRAPEQPILLPVVRFASMLGVQRQMISVYRRWALQAGILVQLESPSREQRRATKFRFRLELFDAQRRQLPRADT
jgi:hypothetical protein